MADSEESIFPKDSEVMKELEAFLSKIEQENKSRTRRTLSRAWDFIRLLILAILAEIGVIILLGVFGTIGLLDYSLIVSLVVVEVPMGVFFWYVLGERRHSKLSEALARAELSKEYGTLRIHRFQWAGLNWYAYLESVKTKKAFDCPDYINELGKWGIVLRIKHKSEEDILTYFKQNGIDYAGREPIPTEIFG